MHPMPQALSGLGRDEDLLGPTFSTQYQNTFSEPGPVGPALRDDLHPADGRGLRHRVALRPRGVPRRPVPRPRLNIQGGETEFITSFVSF